LLRSPGMKVSTSFALVFVLAVPCLVNANPLDVCLKGIDHIGYGLDTVARAITFQKRPYVNPTLPDCASPLMRAMFERSERYMKRHGTLADSSLYVTGSNSANPKVLIDGPEIFQGMADMIADAKFDVNFQTYVWEHDADPTAKILEGIKRLEQNRKRAGATAPVAVRILADAQAIGAGSEKPEPQRAKIRTALAAVDLDRRYVTTEVATYNHMRLGALHSKVLVVDGNKAILTGANPQKHHNAPTPWHDAGFVLEGQVGQALRSEFKHVWEDRSEVRTCKRNRTAARGALPRHTARDRPRCTTRGEDLPPLPDWAKTAPAGCMPMMLATRSADGWFTSDRLDNTQDQALLAMLEHAEDHVNLETPNLNDNEFKDALIEAIVDGLDVNVVLSKGFNDGSKTRMFHDGTNEENLEELYERLRKRGVSNPCERLQVRWYSHDGQTAVVGNGPHSSHTKYTSADGQIAFVGSANLDEQAINHSREVNVVIDDAKTTAEWNNRLFWNDFNRGIVPVQCQ